MSNPGFQKMYRKSFTASNATNEAHADAFSGKHTQRRILKSHYKARTSSKYETAIKLKISLIQIWL